MFAFRKSTLASVAGLALTVGIVGCQPEQPDVVPSTAQKWVSGDGALRYIAPLDGTAYVYDHTSQRLLWSGLILKGQAIEIDPQKMQIMAGTNVVVNKLSAPNDQKDIFFDALPAAQQQSWNNNATPSNSNGVTVTPSVTVQPSTGNSNGVTVQPGVQVAPAQPATPPQQ